MCLHFACRTSSCTLARTLDSLVRVSRRVGYNLAPSVFVVKPCHRTHSMCTRRELHPPMCLRTESATKMTRIAHTTTRGKTRRAPPVSSGPAAVPQPSPQQCAGNRSEKHCTTAAPPHVQSASKVCLAHNSPAAGTRFHPLHSQIFQALLTLFSKFFSPFPHGTCFLSVSNADLALDEIYHPLGAPIPRNVTRRECAVRCVCQCRARLSLSGVPCFKRLPLAKDLAHSMHNTIQIPRFRFAH